MRMLSMLFSVTVLPQIFAQHGLDSWENLSQVRLGQRIEVVDTKLKPVQGQFASYTDGGLKLRVGQDLLSIPRAEVVSVKDREGPRRARNAWLGMAVGAAGGAALGAIRGKNYHEEGETGVFMLVWTPIGAGIGAGVGAMLPGRHVTIYRVTDLPPR